MEQHKLAFDADGLAIRGQLFIKPMPGRRIAVPNTETAQDRYVRIDQVRFEATMVASDQRSEGGRADAIADLVLSIRVGEADPDLTIEDWPDLLDLAGTCAGRGFRSSADVRPWSAQSGYSRSARTR